MRGQQAGGENPDFGGGRRVWKGPDPATPGVRPMGLRRVVQPLAQRRTTLIDPAKDDAIAFCSLSHLIGGSGHAPDIGVKMGGIQGEALAIMEGWGADSRAQWVLASPCKPEEPP